MVVNTCRLSWWRIWSRMFVHYGCIVSHRCVHRYEYTTSELIALNKSTNSCMIALYYILNVCCQKSIIVWFLCQRKRSSWRWLGHAFLRQCSTLSIIFSRWIWVRFHYLELYSNKARMYVMFMPSLKVIYFLVENPQNKTLWHVDGFWKNEADVRLEGLLRLFQCRGLRSCSPLLNYNLFKEFVHIESLVLDYRRC